MGDNLNLVPQQPARWIKPDGTPTPEFYRFIVSLLSLAGGQASITLVELETLVVSSPKANPSGVSQLQADVATIRAQLALLPRPAPDLTAAVERLTALALMQPRAPDLTDRVTKLEALVFGGLLQ